MRFFLAAVFMTLCAATANAAFIYKVDHTFGVYALTGTIETNINNGVITGILPQDSFSLTMTDTTITVGDPGRDITILNVFIDGDAVIATPAELQYDFSKVPSNSANTSLLFSNSNFPSHLWCLQTTTGCSSPRGQYESIFINNSLVLQEARSGIVTLATVVPVPAAVWLFGSGLIGLAGIARRKR